MNIDDLLLGRGVDPSQFVGDTMDYEHRVEQQKAGVRFRQPSGEYEQVTSYSSNVDAVRYDPQEDTIYILFNNRRENAQTRLYVYHNLRAHGVDAAELFNDIATAASPGHVVWEQVRRAGVPFNRFA